MFEKKSTNDESNKTDASLSVSRPSKGSAKFFIGIISRILTASKGTIPGVMIPGTISKV